MGLVWLLVVFVVLTEAAVYLACRVNARCVAAALRTPLLVIALGVAPLLVISVFIRAAPLDSPYAATGGPGWLVLDARGVALQRQTADGLRVPVRLDEIAPIMVDATIAAEDKRFRSHPGVDPMAMARSLVELPFKRSGASTLTQQLARRLYLDASAPLLERKAREALLALQLEARYSKDEILTLYLNEVYYGRGAYGVEAAARIYFGVSAANLDLAQAAFLAGLPQRPVEFGESLQSPAVVGRQQYVLGRLAANGRITPAEARNAATEALQLLPSQSAVLAPHFVGYVLDELARVRPDLEGRKGLVIETTLDSGLQWQAEQQVAFQLASLEDNGVGNAAVVVVEPASGRILTLVGSARFDQADGQINMALAPRQPGSALKPFLYATAFERGYTAASMLLDISTSFDTETGPYQPLNYDRRFNGPVPLRVALASSLNLPAVRTLDEVGIDAFLEMAHRFGLSTLTDTEVYGLALTLGGGAVSLLDLTNAYAALANGGQRVEPYAIERIRDARGDVLYERPRPRTARVLSEEDAFILADILSDAQAREIGFGYAPTLEMPFRAAVKTGTTTEYRDNWTVGFTPERAVGVWVGNADNSPMRNVSGIEGAGPIWHGVMEASMRGLPATWPDAPSGLSRVTVCVPTGGLPGPDCPTRTREWFRAGTAPTEVEDYYARDALGRLVLNPPHEARAWAAAAGLQLQHESGRDATAFVVSPANGSVLYFSPELANQSAFLRASPPPGTRAIEFYIDGSLAGTASSADPAIVWRLTAGRHLLEVRALLSDGTQAVAQSRFEVKR